LARPELGRTSGAAALDLIRRQIALLSGVEVARQKHGATSLIVIIDSLSLKKQLGRDLEDLPAPTADVVRRLREEIARFDRVEIRWGPTTRKRHRSDEQPTADALARKAAGLKER
jgi:hypothetical protein